VQGTASHDPVVTWEVQQRHVHHLMNNDTALTLEVILRPRAVAEMGQEVKNRLSLGAFWTG
jgi:plasmid maintenance system antidote protein VapI